MSTAASPSWLRRAYVAGVRGLETLGRDITAGMFVAPSPGPTAHRSVYVENVTTPNVAEVKRQMRRTAFANVVPTPAPRRSPSVVLGESEGLIRGASRDARLVQSNLQLTDVRVQVAQIRATVAELRLQASRLAFQANDREGERSERRVDVVTTIEALAENLGQQVLELAENREQLGVGVDRKNVGKRHEELPALHGRVTRYVGRAFLAVRDQMHRRAGSRRSGDLTRSTVGDAWTRRSAVKQSRPVVGDRRPGGRP